MRRGEEYGYSIQQIIRSLSPFAGGSQKDRSHRYTELLQTLSYRATPPTHRPVVVQVTELVGQPLEVVGFESRGVGDDVVVRRSHRALTDTLAHKEEVIPSTREKGGKTVIYPSKWLHTLVQNCTQRIGSTERCLLHTSFPLNSLRNRLILAFNHAPPSHPLAHLQSPSGHPTLPPHTPHPPLTIPSLSPPCPQPCLVEG